jgi:hypothetical protein
MLRQDCPKQKQGTCMPRHNGFVDQSSVIVECCIRLYVVGLDHGESYNTSKEDLMYVN